VNIKAIKYNKVGLTRAENTTPKFVMPKKDLNENNIKITLKSNYISVIKKDK
jgi:hypothetical protein